MFFVQPNTLPAGGNPKGAQKNEICQMDMFHFAEFGKLKYVLYTFDTYSGFQWTISLSLEKADTVTKHFLEIIAIMDIHVQIKSYNALAYFPRKMKVVCLL